MVSIKFWQWFTEYATPRIDAGDALRSISFRKAFEYLDRFENPVIVETGCIHGEDEDLCWGGHGCSTILFNNYVSLNNGRFWSVDINPERVRQTEKLISKNSQILCGDGIEFLKNFAKHDQFPSPHLVYLDSFDIDWAAQTESQAHHYNELRAILPKLTTDSLVLVDDSFYLLDTDGEYRIGGKGGLIAKYAAEMGVALAFSGYQTAWKGFPGSRTTDSPNSSSQKIVYEQVASNKVPSALLVKAATFIRNEKFEDGEMLCDEVILSGEFLDKAYEFKGNIEAKLGNHEKAIGFYEKALEYPCFDKSMIYYGLALSLHSIGRYKEGWQYMFLARLSRTVPRLYMPVKRFTNPFRQLFVNQPPPATIHVHAEAGEGDNFAMLRYLPMLRDKGYTVRYEAKLSMVKLAQSSFPDMEVMPPADDYPGSSGIKDFDYHLPITTLPYVFGTDIDSVPWNGPYIKADSELVEKYKRCKGRIGISWSTGPNVGVLATGYARRKSIPFGLLKPIIDVDPSLFVSLQAGQIRHENNRIIDCLPSDIEMTWADTAALIENLDLVVTVDTAVAHLAGAMGKPVWLMMHGHNNGWHFMSERPGASWNTKSPWYPSMTIFRQKERGDWPSVTGIIAAELIKLVTPEFTKTSSWSDNIPFAFWLVEHIKPKMFVELGVYTGVSYFAICRAVEALGLGTKCFAIDTWKGDQHTKPYDESVYEDFVRYEKKYSFSTVIRSTFEDALDRFEDNSIDLLHIDGEHSYESVKRDFESWLPKLTQNAVVLFHDVLVSHFGVWMFWNELIKEYPGFLLTHGCGLGVLSLDGSLTEMPFEVAAE